MSESSTLCGFFLMGFAMHFPLFWQDLASTIFVVIVIAIFAGLPISLLNEDQGILTDRWQNWRIRSSTHFPPALLSLVQVVSGDGLADMYYPLMLARPELSLIFHTFVCPCHYRAHEFGENKSINKLLGSRGSRKRRFSQQMESLKSATAGFQQPISQRNSELSNWMSCSQSW